MPSTFPAPHAPAIDARHGMDVLPDAPLRSPSSAASSRCSRRLSPMRMSGRRHRSNCELVAQGFANIGAALFGGFMRDRHHRPHRHQCPRRRDRACLRHAACRFSCSPSCCVAAPLASYIPLAALAGMLAVVAWNMAERHEFVAILSARAARRVVLLATFLSPCSATSREGILVGVVLGSFLFMHRMAELVAVEWASL